ncbi:MAG TPA: hypothetical protein VIO60_11385 [Rectinemataceae bacterium]
MIPINEASASAKKEYELVNLAGAGQLQASTIALRSPVRFDENYDDDYDEFDEDEDLEDDEDFDDDDFDDDDEDFDDDFDDDDEDFDDDDEDFGYDDDVEYDDLDE